jgi:hypothetical protein
LYVEVLSANPRDAMPRERDSTWKSECILLKKSSHYLTMMSMMPLNNYLPLLWVLLSVVGIANGFQSPLFASQSRTLSAKKTLPKLGLSLEPTSNHVTTIENTKSLFQVIDEAGLSLKPKAYRASEQASRASRQSEKLLYLIKTSLFYTMFIIYRGYRGIFVILPAVFQQVYQKLEAAVESPFPDSNGGIGSDDINPATGRVRWRTRITVSILASFVTLSYVVQGGMRVALKFFKNLTKTSDVSGSFAAAAMEQEANEQNLVRMAKPNDTINGLPSDKLKP